MAGGGGVLWGFTVTVSEKETFNKQTRNSPIKTYWNGGIRVKMKARYGMRGLLLAASRIVNISMEARFSHSDRRDVG